MMIRTLLIPIALLCMAPNAYPQTSSPRESLLWEISGDKLPGRSYIYGSAHLNDRRIFAFDDSLYFALRSCRQFAAEVDFAQVDTFISRELSTMFERAIAEGETEDKATDRSSTDVFNQLSPDGKPTLLDAYLYRAAVNLGLSSHGLEQMDDQQELMGSMAKIPTDERNKGEWYETLIEAYTRGDLEAIAKMIDELGYDWKEDLATLERNQLQAASFEQLAVRQPTFAVIGAAHLFGQEDVLELLQARGHRVRRVQYGQTSPSIDSLYDLGSSLEWGVVRGQILPFSLRSNVVHPPSSIYGLGEFHFATEFDQGLIYTSILLPPTPNDARYLVPFAIANFFPDTLALIPGPVLKKDDLTQYNYTNLSEHNAFRGRITISESICAVQMVLGLSVEALNNERVDQYLDGIKINAATEGIWTRQVAEDGAFTYLFPADIPWVENEIVHPDFTERGMITIRYKAFLDPISLEEYLIRYFKSPPGVNYPNPYHAHRLVIDQLANAYRAEVTEFDFSINAQALEAQAVLTDAAGIRYYLRSVSRGSFMYLFLQKSPSGHRHTRFFMEPALLIPEFSESQSFSYPPAGFTMPAPDQYYAYETIDNGDTVHNFDFNLDGSGVTMSIRFTEFSPYEELNLHDSIFTVEQMVDMDALDSLHYFRKYRYQDTCPGYILEHHSDSSHLYQTEFALFCNGHFTSVQIIAPDNLRGAGYVEKLLQSVTFELNDRSVSTLTEDKRSRILQDLATRDSATFEAALAAFLNYDNFQEEDLPALYQLLAGTFPDDSARYNARYAIVAELMNFPSDEVSRQLISYYSDTENEAVRSLILQRFGQDELTCDLGHLLQLLEQTPPDQTLPAGLFAALRDSLRQIEQHYPRLQALAGQTIAEEAILELLVSCLERAPAASSPFIDMNWLADRINERLDQFFFELAVDPHTSIDAYVMDYFLMAEADSTTAEVYRAIARSEDPYGKYRIVYNQLAQGYTPADTLLDRVMTSDYYRYWVLSAYADFDRQLPDRFIDPTSNAKAILKRQVYDELGSWCNECSVIRELSAEEVKYGRMLLVKCDSSEQEGAYFLGCVGPFDEQGRFDFERNESLYFTDVRTDPNPLVYLDELLQHLNDN